MAKKVQIGTEFVFKGVTYRFGPSSTSAYNDWTELVRKGLSPEKGAEIHLFSADETKGRFIHPMEIEKAIGE